MEYTFEQTGHHFTIREDGKDIAFTAYHSVAVNICNTMNRVNFVSSNVPVSGRSELLDALKRIESVCDNQNPTHETIWRIANAAIQSIQ